MKRIISTLILLLLISTARVSVASFQIDRARLVSYYNIGSLTSSLRQIPDTDLPIVLAIIKTESNFDRFAQSRTGDLGLMQVNRYFHPEIEQKWQSAEFNIGIGYKIWVSCLERSETIFSALCKYNGDKSGRYAKKVLTEYMAIRNIIQ